MAAVPSAPLHALRDPIVRDLAWALGSPPLAAAHMGNPDWPDAAVYQALMRSYTPRLQALDIDPTPLHNAVMAARDGRLGGYFEALWRFWLQDTPDRALCAHNLPIRSGGDTLGELDLLVEDRASGRLQHWELAVKFYLGVGDTSAASAWLGPDVQDRLDRKLQHLRAHQLPLLRHPATQAQLAERGWNVAEQRVVLKGRLFYPLGETLPPPVEAAPGHLHGWWAYAPAFIAHFGSEPLRWRLLARQDWLAPLHPEQATGLLRAADLAQPLRDAHRPLCVAGFLEGDESTRGFIVPQAWPT